MEQQDAVVTGFLAEAGPKVVAMMPKQKLAVVEALLAQVSVSRRQGIVRTTLSQMQENEAKELAVELVGCAYEHAYADAAGDLALAALRHRQERETAVRAAALAARAAAAEPAAAAAAGGAGARTTRRRLDKVESLPELVAALLGEVVLDAWRLCLGPTCGHLLPLDSAPPPPVCPVSPRAGHGKAAFRSHLRFHAGRHALQHQSPR